MDIVKLVWIDIETTGLDNLLIDGVMSCHHHDILELGIHITDKDLNIIDEGLTVVLALREDTLEKMCDFVRDMHTNNGLIDRCRESTTTLEEAQDIIIDYLKAHDIPEGKFPLAGNTCKLDYNFMTCHMNRLIQYMHFRLFDVSVFKMAAAMWDRETYDSVQKAFGHRALDDIRESIDEMRVYHKRYFVKSVN